jgi:tRNA(Ile)-lysidine synthase
MRVPALETAFNEFIGRHHLLDEVVRLVVAVSGGIDSMVLLSLLVSRARHTPLRLEIAHVNHKLRGDESDRDEEFVRRSAEELGLRCHLFSTDRATSPGRKGGSVQETARTERYTCFESLRGDGGNTRVATAHNRDDNAETVLFNFLRGSGVHGLTGIPVIGDDGYIVRPLLFASRKEITEYADLRKIRSREDSSNAGQKYTRNVIRHRLIPEIESAVNPGLRNTLGRTTELFTELESFLRVEVERAISEIITDRTPAGTRLDVPLMKGFHGFLRESVFHTLAKRFVPGGISYAQVRTLMKLLDAPSGSSCSIVGNFHGHRDRETLLLTTGPPPAPFRFPVTADSSYRFHDFSFESSYPDEVSLGRTRYEEYVDADLLGKELILRSWNDGDWFMPFGLGAKKKVSDFFIDRKVPVTEKQNIPLLVSDNEIVWICGYRLDERFGITPGTKTILRLSYTPEPA